jgi:exonuclease VII large subunit
MATAAERAARYRDRRKAELEQLRRELKAALRRQMKTKRRTIKPKKENRPHAERP